MEYPVWPIENSSACGANEDIFWSVTFSFYLPLELKINIDFGLDMGLGFAIFNN